ncbi:MAG: SGNH/GDSL hydrolase family protein [Sphingobacteriales bacterium]|jgi:lysophospholipase L1-like esterase
MSTKFIPLIVMSLLFSSFTSPTQKIKKVLFFGDSITEAGVKSGGYIDVLNTMLKEQKLDDQYELVGAGIGGNKVYDLYLRMETDVLSKKPDIVVIFIGVNDVWHKQSMGTGTDADKFSRFYQAIISKLKAQNISIILATPAVIGEKTDHSNQLDGDLNRYSNLIRELAKKENLPLVDLRKAFLDFNLKNNPENKDQGILTTDRVHLNAAGNKLVAERMWQVIKTLN